MDVLIYLRFCEFTGFLKSLLGDPNRPTDNDNN